MVKSSPGCLGVDPQGNGGVQVVQLLGASHHQAVLSYLQCQPLGSILAMRESAHAPSIGKPCLQGPSIHGYGFNPQHKNNGGKTQRTIILSLTELKPRTAAAAAVTFSRPREATASLPQEIEPRPVQAPVSSFTPRSLAHRPPSSAPGCPPALSPD